MAEQDTQNTARVSEQKRERLRQERETFDQHKSHESCWFHLRLVMGYLAAVLLLVIIGICVYVFLNHAELPAAIVSAASAAFFVDVVGLAITIWKIVFNSDFTTKLAPLTQNPPTDVISEDTPYKPTEDDLKAKEISILSAKYGKGQNTNDVTGIVKAIVAAVAARRVRFTVDNDTLGGDPLKGEGKDLTLVYSYAGKTHTITVREREELSLP